MYLIFDLNIPYKLLFLTFGVETTFGSKIAPSENWKQGGVGPTNPLPPPPYPHLGWEGVTSPFSGTVGPNIVLMSTYHNKNHKYP